MAFLFYSIFIICFVSSATQCMEKKLVIEFCDNTHRQHKIPTEVALLSSAVQNCFADIGIVVSDSTTIPDAPCVFSIPANTQTTERLITCLDCAYKKEYARMQLLFRTMDIHDVLHLANALDYILPVDTAKDVIKDSKKDSSKLLELVSAHIARSVCVVHDEDDTQLIPQLDGLAYGMQKLVAFEMTKKTGLYTRMCERHGKYLDDTARVIDCEHYNQYEFLGNKIILFDNKNKKICIKEGQDKRELLWNSGNSAAEIKNFQVSPHGNTWIFCEVTQEHGGYSRKYFICDGACVKELTKLSGNTRKERGDIVFVTNSLLCFFDEMLYVYDLATDLCLVDSRGEIFSVGCGYKVKSDGNGNILLYSRDVIFLGEKKDLGNDFVFKKIDIQQLYGNNNQVSYNVEEVYFDVKKQEIFLNMTRSMGSGNNPLHCYNYRKNTTKIVSFIDKIVAILPHYIIVESLIVESFPVNSVYSYTIINRDLKNSYTRILTEYYRTNDYTGEFIYGYSSEASSSHNGEKIYIRRNYRVHPLVDEHIEKLGEYFSQKHLTLPEFLLLESLTRKNAVGHTLTGGQEVVYSKLPNAVKMILGSFGYTIH